MQVIASLEENYVFEVQPDEAIHITGIYQDLIDGVRGLTFPIYQSVPTYALQGATFNEVQHEKTRTFQNQTEFLLSLNMVFHIDMQKPVLIESIPVESWKTFKSENGAFKCNHIPQIGMLTEFGYIVSVWGEYNWKNKRFNGVLRFSDEIITGKD